MGAAPRHCLVTLCAAGDTEVEDLLAVQRGICAVALATGCRVAGGDVSAIAGPLVIDISVIGAVAPGRALRRDGGRPGDSLLVTGRLGGAAAGLGILMGRLAAPPEADLRWRERQLRPRARLAEGLALAAAGVLCAGDLSDGLIVDVGRIIDASACGAELWLDSLPVDADLRGVLGAGWAEAAMGGGEDFGTGPGSRPRPGGGAAGGLAQGAGAAVRHRPAGRGAGHPPARGAGGHRGAAAAGPLPPLPGMTRAATRGGPWVLTASPAATQAVAARLGALLAPGDLVALDGPLGAGKTVFVRGLAAGRGVVPELVRSPTFVLHHVYGSPPLLHHVDLYRLGPGAAIALLDLDTLLESAPAAVEWGSYGDLAAWRPLRLTLDIDGDTARRIGAPDPGSASPRLAAAWRAAAEVGA